MKNSKLVYSTDQGKINHADTPLTPPEFDGFIRLSRETKGRKGKGVTLISGFGEDEKKLKSRAKALKQLCGTGGAVKGFVIEIQGDQRDVIESNLTEQGFKVKRSGG